MILRFVRLLLLLTMLLVPPTSTVPSAGAVNLDKCSSRSLCLLHKDCFTTSTSRGSIEWLQYTGAGTSNNRLANTQCTKAVEITPLSPSSWSVEMHGVAQLDSLVTCSGGVARSVNDKVILRTHSRPPSSSSSSNARPPLPSTHCRALLSTKDGSELKSLLSSSTIKVDTKDSDVKYEAIGVMACHPPPTLFSCANESRSSRSRQLGAGSLEAGSGSVDSGACALPVRQLLTKEKGGKREEVVQWTCAKPFKMRSSTSPYHPDSVKCEQGKMWIVEGTGEHSVSAGTRIACRMSSEDICYELKTNGSSPLKWDNSTTPARWKCSDHSSLLAGGQKSAWLPCSGMSTIDHPVMETDRGQLVSVNGGVECDRIPATSCKFEFEQLMFECGPHSDQNQCPPNSCRLANFTTLWPATKNGSISEFEVEVDKVTCDMSTHRFLAYRTQGGKNRTIEVGRGSKVACRERGNLTRSAARQSLKLREEKAATIGLPTALLLALIVIPLIFFTCAHSLVSRCMNGSDRSRHAKLSVGVAQSNDLELNSDRAANNTIQSKYGGSEMQKISIAECIRQFFRDRCSKQKSRVERESIRQDEEEKSGNIVEVTAPAKDSVVEPKSNPPSVIKSAPASLPSGPVKSGGPESTEKKDEEKKEEKREEKEGMKELSGMAQPTSSVSKQITKSDPPSQVSKATSSNSGGVPSKQQSASGAAPSS